MEKKNLTCIGCPMGCQITVEFEGEEVFSVTGNTCAIGDKYARQEVTPAWTRSTMSRPPHRSASVTL